MRDIKSAMKLVKWVLFGLGAVALLFVFSSTVYTVSEQEQAVVTQFGKAVDVKTAGLHYKIPFIQKTYIVDMTTRGMEFGYDSKDFYNATNDVSIPTESLMITQDFNFVNVDFFVEWRVSNPIKYLFNSEDAEELLRNILQSEARTVVSGYSVDAVLTTAKGEIQTKLKDSVLKKVEQYDLGIVVSNITVQDTEPPTEEVIAAFKNVENAKQYKDTEINNAKTYYNEEIPKARAEADKIVKAAESERESRINEATGQVARFNEMYAEYSRNMEITRTRMYLEAMEDILPGVKVYVDGGGSEPLKLLPLTPAEGGSAQ